jgi:hypothetical protein
MRSLARIAAAVVSIASISSAATAQPSKYNQCYELTVARGYTNMAPGRAQFFYDCMSGRRRVTESARVEAPPRSSGPQTLCDSAGCRPARKGCRVEAFPASNGTSAGGRQREVCD